MWKLAAVILLTSVLWIAAEPPWMKPGTCLAPDGTACRTLVYEISGWTNRGWGIPVIERYTSRKTEAVRSDGATMVRDAHNVYRNFLLLSERYDRARIVFKAQKKTFEIEHTLNEFRDLGGVWGFAGQWVNDPDCGSFAKGTGIQRRTGRMPVIAGVRAIEYQEATPDNSIAQTIAFAPSLGCSVASFQISQRNTMGLPTSWFQLKLTSVTLAEPDRRLFEIPPGYHEMPSDRVWPYIRLDELPGYVARSMFSSPTL